MYGFTQDADGSWRYGKDKLMFNRCRQKYEIENDTWII